ncbi:MAG: acyl-CoA thioesterase [Flammeovirgaceae bacterium]
MIENDKALIQDKPAIKAELTNYPTVKKIVVEWGEMDAAQHVNNTHYLKWFEASRVIYLEEMAKGQDFEILRDLGLVVAKQECKYIFPVTFPDIIWIGVRVVEILKDRFVMEAKMVSERHERVVAIAKGYLVPFDFKTHQKAAMPPQTIEQIQALESSVK